MTQLSGKQKRFLRGIGQRTHATCSLGKAGMTDALVADILRQLSRRELVKVRISSAVQTPCDQLAEAIAKATGSSCVGAVGRTCLLYRPNEQMKPEERLSLPQD